eukprot:g922.t1
MGKVTSGKYGEKGRRKEKKKSIKTKATGKAVGSRRRTARMGKVQKKGHRGEAATFITRSQAVRRLQVTLRDFRRLCILRGIHPRDPKKKSQGTNKTYYHVKDIMHLKHEPLLEKFMEFKAFMKKVRKCVGRDKVHQAQDMWENRPTYTLHHVVRERYPHFEDAIADMDDALCMVHLFANLSAEGLGKHEVTKMCERLCREFQNYVVHTHSLRKVFFSVKGIYFQAEIAGEKVTWVVPYRFSHAKTEDVDYKVMGTFLEFYDTFMRFVMFKLYHDAGLQYPPVLKEDADANAAHLGAIEIRKRDATTDKAEEESSTSTGETSDDHAGREVEERMKSLSSKMKDIRQTSENAQEGEKDGDEASTNKIVAEDVFADDEQAKALQEKQKLIEIYTSLFAGCRFFLNRECPRETLEFIIRAFGGEVGWDGASSVFGYNDAAVTHCVVDRPKLNRKKIEGREYVQPQWIADCINARMLLPTAPYAHGSALPPHLSPFVNDAEEEYVPEYREKISELQAAAGVPVVDDKVATKSESVDAEDGDVHAEARSLAKIMMPAKKRKLHAYISKKREQKTKDAEKLNKKRMKIKDKRRN